MLSIFVGIGWRLRYWHLNFTLNQLGEGRFYNSDKINQFQIEPHTFVSPYIAGICYRHKGKLRWKWLFADMFDDDSYRLLCRLLLQCRNSKNKIDL